MVHVWIDLARSTYMHFAAMWLAGMVLYQLWFNTRVDPSLLAGAR